MTDEFLVKDIHSLKDDSLVLFSNVELSIQRMNNVFVPAIVFENPRLEEWDYDDLYDILKELGELDILETNKHFAIALFTNFFDAYSALEFLLDINSFKEIAKVNFILRWYKLDDNIHVTRNFKRKIQHFLPMTKIIDCSPTPVYNNPMLSSFSSLVNNQINNNNSFKKVQYKNSDPCLNNQNFNNNFNYSPNIPYLNPQRMDMFNHPFGQNHHPNTIPNYPNGGQYISKSPQVVYNNVNMQEFNPSINNFNINQFNSSVINGLSGFTLNSGNYQEKPNNNGHKKKNSSHNFEKKMHEKVSTEKYTCKYEIQIENNNDFQVAKKLIGCNGCNMKNIVEFCNKNNQSNQSNGESVKLRLRGKGSGYKEGPENRESEENLHLCVSSKFPDIFILACNHVEVLLRQIYEDYKRYCDKKGIQFQQLEIKRVDGVNSLVGLSSKLNEKKSSGKQKAK